MNLNQTLQAFVAPVLLLPLILFVQVKIGYEVALFPLYMVPVAKLTWEFGPRGGIFSVLAASICWISGAHLSGNTFSSDWILYYNAGVRGFMFAMVSVFLLLFKKTVDQHRQRMEAMRSLLCVCHGCGSIQKNDGSWVALEDIDGQVRHENFECPRCSKVERV